MNIPATIFYSYASADELYRQKLETHLSLLRHQGLISEWHDRLIMPGTDWKDALDDHLNTASIILLLISPDFLHSDYLYGFEMQRALERYEKEQIHVVPILLRPVDLQGAPFANLQCLPKNGEFIATWTQQDQSFLEVVQGIREIIEGPISQHTNFPQREISQTSHSSPRSSLSAVPPQDGLSMKISQEADTVEGKMLGGKGKNIGRRNIDIGQTVKEVKEGGSIIGFVFE